MIKEIAAVVTAIVVFAIVAITLFVGRSKKNGGEGSASVYKIRNIYFILLMTVIAGLLLVTLKSDLLPYTGLKNGNPDYTVEVIGRTWSWELSSEKIPAGKVIEFSVTSEDVTHGFGVYDSEGNLLAQIQVMPGVKTSMFYQFDKPGIYHVLCMEYCGMAHQNMITQFEVVNQMEEEV